MLKSMKEYDQNTVFLISECAVADEYIGQSEIISESVNETGIVGADGNPIRTVKVQTVLQSFDVQNWNGRIYGADLVMNSIDNDGMIQNDIKMEQWMGEFSHPLEQTPIRQMTLFDPCVSHRILKYWREGNILKGIVETVPYGKGKDLYNKVVSGIPFAASLRALGSVDLKTKRAKYPLKVVTFDAVNRPSHIEAYGEKLLTESAGGVYVPAKDVSIKDIITESCVFEPIQESASQVDEIVNHLRHTSENIKVAMDMFGVEECKGVLTESGTHVSFAKQGEGQIVVPVEKVLTLQYNDLLNI